MVSLVNRSFVHSSLSFILKFWVFFEFRLCCAHLFPPIGSPLFPPGVFILSFQTPPILLTQTFPFCLLISLSRWRLPLYWSTRGLFTFDCLFPPPPLTTPPYPFLRPRPFSFSALGLLGLPPPHPSLGKPSSLFHFLYFITRSP